MNVMTQKHPRFEEFLDTLASPDHCNFREDADGKVNWNCDNTPNRPHARAVLSEMGFDGEETEASLLAFEKFGGYCDCEIILNAK